MKNSTILVGGGIILAAALFLTKPGQQVLKSLSDSLGGIGGGGGDGGVPLPGVDNSGLGAGFLTQPPNDSNQILKDSADKSPPINQQEATKDNYNAFATNFSQALKDTAQAISEQTGVNLTINQPLTGVYDVTAPIVNPQTQRVIEQGLSNAIQTSQGGMSLLTGGIRLYDNRLDTPQLARINQELSRPIQERIASGAALQTVKPTQQLFSPTQYSSSSSVSFSGGGGYSSSNLNTPASPSSSTTQTRSAAVASFAAAPSNQPAPKLFSPSQYSGGNVSVLNYTPAPARKLM